MHIPKKQTKERVMFTIDLALLEQLDALAERLNASRSATIAYSIEQLVKQLERETKYKIVRFFSDQRERVVMLRGLSLEDAKAHCKDPSTREHGVYFDGYEEE